MAFSMKNKTGVNIHVHRNPLRLCAIAARRIAGAGSAVDGPRQIQFRRRQQRSGPGSGRRPGRRDQCRAPARGQDAGDLRPCQRSAGLSSAARIPHRETQARRRHRLQRRRHHDRFGLAAGARSRQSNAAGARRHRAGRTGDLSGRAEPADAARRQGGRHSPRRPGHADGCAGGSAGRPQEPRHHAEIHLHHPDRAKPDRLDHAGDAARGNAETVAAIWRADLRGRLLRRPDLERRAPARDLRDEPSMAASFTSARSRNRSRRPCASASSSHPGR